MLTCVTHARLILYDLLCLLDELHRLAEPSLQLTCRGYHCRLGLIRVPSLRGRIALWARYYSIERRSSAHAPERREMVSDLQLGRASRQRRI